MDHFEINIIDLKTLGTMEALLSASVGYPTSMPDEISYFEEESPKGWLCAADKDGNKVGFIRYFNQGNDWSHGELYVEPKALLRKTIAVELLNSFLALNLFTAGHRLRFDFTSSDGELNGIFKNLKHKYKHQTFHYFEIETSDQSGSQNHEVSCQSVNLKEVAETLSNLHPVSEGEAQDWLGDGSLRIEMSGEHVAAVAQINFYPDSAEVNRIATNKNFLRRGCARSLLEKISKELYARGIKKLFLKVEDVRTPAISFYKAVGFLEVIENKETWHSIYF